MNLLIIEDDLFLANKIKIIFEKNNLINRVKILSTFDSFLCEFYLINSYDIILVDIILWKWIKKNWIDIVQYIRDKNIVLPIIIISWINDIWFLKLAFDKWANDYICKPFRINELEIRVLKWFNNFFSNNKLVNKSFLKYDSLIYDFTQNVFYFNWYELILTKTSKYLLLLFVSKSEELLSEIYLVEKIWWDSNLFDRNLRIVIYRLKKSLELYWIDWWIKNIRWEWYILEKN